MKAFFILLFNVLFLISSWSQSDPAAILYTRQFTELVAASGLEFYQDSLEQYLLTDQLNPYIKNTERQFFHHFSLFLSAVFLNIWPLAGPNIAKKGGS